MNCLGAVAVTLPGDAPLAPLAPIAQSPASVARSSAEAHDTLTYKRIIDDIVSAMQLQKWAWFSDYAIRDILPFEASDGAEYLEQRLLQIVWPGVYVALEDSARNTMQAFVAFVNHFESFAEYTQSGIFLRADLSFKSMAWTPQYQYMERKHLVWSHLNCAYLSRVVVNLNEFASSVRTHLDPSFFAEQGRFLVHDSVGFRGRGGPYLPDRAWVDQLTTHWEREFTALGSPPSAGGER